MDVKIIPFYNQRSEINLQQSLQLNSDGSLGTLKTSLPS